MVRQKRTKTLLAIAFLGYASVIDCISTILGLNHGLVEANPVALLGFELIGIWAFFAIKISMSIALATGILLHTEKRTTLEHNFGIVAIITWGFFWILVAIHNMRLILLI